MVKGSLLYSLPNTWVKVFQLERIRIEVEGAWFDNNGMSQIPGVYTVNIVIALLQWNRHFKWIVYAFMDK